MVVHSGSTPIPRFPDSQVQVEDQREPIKSSAEVDAAPGATGLDQLKGVFLASLNHEIRTPLSGIVGMLDLLSETSLDPDQAEYLNAARLCTDSLAELLNATLEFTALEAGQYSLDESEFSVREALDAAVAQQQAKAALKNLKLSIAIDSAVPETLIGDAPRVREVAARLIGNAIKFTQAGSIDVRAEIRADVPSGTHQAESRTRLRISVRDTGIGIPVDQLEDIFQSFQQAESGLSRNYPGLGLGLALVKKLATVMGGTIRVDSKVGQGSTFTVEIPLRSPASSVERAELALGLDPPLILAVEDNPINLRVLRQVLERRRLRVFSAASGPEALAAVQEHRFDLILMDLQMPGMDGLETTAAIRKLPLCADVPILALTANCADQVRERCFQAGMQAFLSKPLNSKELWSTLSRYLKQDLTQ